MTTKTEPTVESSPFSPSSPFTDDDINFVWAEVLNLLYWRSRKLAKGARVEGKDIARVSQIVNMVLDEAPL